MKTLGTIAGLIAGAILGTLCFFSGLIVLGFIAHVIVIIMSIGWNLL